MVSIDHSYWLCEVLINKKLGNKTPSCGLCDEPMEGKRFVSACVERSLSHVRILGFQCKVSSSKQALMKHVIIILIVVNDTLRVKKRSFSKSIILIILVRVRRSPQNNASSVTLGVKHV